MLESRFLSPFKKLDRIAVIGWDSGALPNILSRALSADEEMGHG
jgi:hypothetical protein